MAWLGMIVILSLFGARMPQGPATDQRVILVPDRNGDGVPEALVLEPRAALDTDRVGRARLIDGIDGRVLHTWFGRRGERFALDGRVAPDGVGLEVEGLILDDSGHLHRVRTWFDGGRRVSRVVQGPLHPDPVIRAISPDLSGDGVIDLRDVETLAEAVLRGDPSADLDQDGDADEADLVLLLDRVRRPAPAIVEVRRRLGSWAASYPDDPIVGAEDALGLDWWTGAGLRSFEGYAVSAWTTGPCAPRLVDGLASGLDCPCHPHAMILDCPDEIVIGERVTFRAEFGVCDRSGWDLSGTMLDHVEWW
ncbi:MAG: hypothetical protein KDA28_16670, partial [Phycisphaerales bacterium]|nr:hypothetical protein [Phycisphaerales bacterium]